MSILFRSTLITVMCISMFIVACAAPVLWTAVWPHMTKWQSKQILQKYELRTNGLYYPKDNTGRWQPGSELQRQAEASGEKYTHAVIVLSYVVTYLTVGLSVVRLERSCAIPPETGFA